MESIAEKIGSKRNNRRLRKINKLTGELPKKGTSQNGLIKVNKAEGKTTVTTLKPMGECNIAEKLVISKGPRGVESVDRRVLLANEMGALVDDFTQVEVFDSSNPRRQKLDLDKIVKILKPLTRDCVEVA